MRATNAKVCVRPTMEHKKRQEEGGAAAQIRTERNRTEQNRTENRPLKTRPSKQRDVAIVMILFGAASLYLHLLP